MGQKINIFIFWLGVNGGKLKFGDDVEFVPTGAEGLGWRGLKSALLRWASAVCTVHGEPGRGGSQGESK